MSNMPTTLEIYLTVKGQPGRAGSHALFSPSPLFLDGKPSFSASHTPPPPLPRLTQHILHKVRAGVSVVFICLHIKVLISSLLFRARLRLRRASVSFGFALFWPLNGQPRIRGPSGVTFFIVERHNQWHFNHGKIKICKSRLINICITCLNNRSPDKAAIN